MNTQTHLFDQGRRFVVLPANVGAPLGAGGERTYAVEHTGGNAANGGGYNWISGYFAGDQTIAVDVAQSTTNVAPFEMMTQFPSILEPPGSEVSRVKEPIYTEYVEITVRNTSAFDMTEFVGGIYLSPVEGAPLRNIGGGLQVEGTDADGVNSTNDPIQIAGWVPGGTAVRVPSVAVGAANRQLIVRTSDGTNYGPTMDAVGRRGFVTHTDGTNEMPAGDVVGRAIYHIITDGVDELGVAVDNAAVEAEGIQAMGEYAAVQAARGDGDAARLQTTAYGNLQTAAYIRPLGSDGVIEQAPVEYDIQRNVARASAALTAGNVYDANPTEIPTGGRKWLTLVIAYTRIGAGGGADVRMEGCVTVLAVDYWGREVIINTGAFAAGVDTMSGMQREEWRYIATGAAIEYFIMYFDISRLDKFRIPCAEVLVGAGNEGLCAVYYSLSN